MTQVRNEEDSRLQILNTLLTCPHRDLQSLWGVHSELVRQDPRFYVHLGAWYWDTGAVRDHKEMFAATLIWILWSAIFHSQGRKHRAHYDLGNARKQVLKASLLSAVIFVVVDGNLLFNGLRDLDQAFWNFPAAEARTAASRHALCSAPHSRSSRERPA